MNKKALNMLKPIHPTHNKTQNLLLCLIEESSEILEVLNNKQYINFDGSFDETHLLKETIDFIAVVDLLVKENIIHKNLIPNALCTNANVHYEYNFNDEIFDEQIQSINGSLISTIFQSCKISRFNVDTWTNNIEMVEANITRIEMAIFRVIEKMASIINSKIILTDKRIKEKQDKVLKYMEVSKQKGVLIA